MNSELNDSRNTEKGKLEWSELEVEHKIEHFRREKLELERYL